MFSKKYGVDIDFTDYAKMKADAMSFWQRVYELQRRHGYPLEDMAYSARMEDEEYEELQKSGREPTLHQAAGIAEALGVSIEYLVTGKDYSVYKKRCERICRKLYEIKNSIAKLQSDIYGIVLEESLSDIESDFDNE